MTTCELARLIVLGDSPNSSVSAQQVADQARQIQSWISELKCNKEDKFHPKHIQGSEVYDLKNRLRKLVDQ